MIFRYQITIDDRIIDIPDIVCPIPVSAVFIRTCQATLDHIVIKELRRILFVCIIATEFGKTEREDMDFNISSCKQRSQIRTEQEGI